MMVEFFLDMRHHNKNCSTRVYEKATTVLLFSSNQVSIPSGSFIYFYTDLKKCYITPFDWCQDWEMPVAVRGIP